MQKFYFLSFLYFFLACKETSNKPPTVEKATASVTLRYANGFSVTQRDGYKELTITNPWPGAETNFRYALVPKGNSIKPPEAYDAIVEVPISEIVVTSTTHVPSLEMLDVGSALTGFPNLDHISSEATRKRIADGEIKELGQNESINTEVLIELSPDAVVTFAVEGDNKTVQTIQKTGIPVLYNADWTETHPLGKAEWIKFFGVLFEKEKEADSLFNVIETSYREAKKLAQSATKHPTVLAGAMYKDVWYLPQGDSWAAQFIADANANYLWSDTQGTGSLSLNLESVLEKGQNADYWIAPGQFESLAQLRKAHPVYAEFRALQENRVYNYTLRKGETGGLLYYEIAPNRPDWVLRDLISIFHPELLPDHSLYFFSILR
jgi:iron complex transport system substrate-binding protein